MCLAAKDRTLTWAFPLLPPPLLLLCRNVGGNGNDNNKCTLAMICFTVSICLGGNNGGNNGNRDKQQQSVRTP
jgi:hypothetical protein